MTPADANGQLDLAVVVASVEHGAVLFQQGHGLAIGHPGGDLDLPDVTEQVPADGFAQDIEPFLGEGADRHRLRLPVQPHQQLPRIAQQIDLVEGQDAGLPGGPDLVKGPVNRLQVHRRMLAGCIEHEDQQVGVHRLFQRRAERSDQVVGQVADEPDRVGKHQRVAAAQIPPLDPGGQRRKQLAVGKRAAGGEVIEQRGLARVGVADEADGVMVEVATLHLADLALPNAVQLLPELAQPPLDDPPVDLQLLFAGTAGADADRRPADDLLQMVPHCSKTRIGVLQLGDFHLKLGGVGRGPVGEDVEDELAAVDHLALRGLLHRPDLARREVVVKDDQRGPGRSDQVGQLARLALAEKRPSAGLVARLDQLADHDGPRGLREFPQLAERIVRIEELSRQVYGGKHRPFRCNTELFAVDLGQRLIVDRKRRHGGTEARSEWIGRRAAGAGSAGREAARLSLRASVPSCLRAFPSYDPTDA